MWYSYDVRAGTDEILFPRSCLCFMFGILISFSRGSDPSGPLEMRKEETDDKPVQAAAAADSYHDRQS